MGKLVSKLSSKDARDASSGKQHIDTFQTNLIKRNNTDAYSQTYTEGKLLGEGITGSVREVVHIATGKKFAMKTINLEKIDKAQLRELKTEIDILRQLDHPNIVKLHEVFQDDKSNTIKLIMELLTGGDLSKRMLETEEEIRAVVHQVVSAVRYFHLRGVVHRDLKLENVLYSTESPDSNVKVIDFGLGGRFYSDELVAERQRMEERRGITLSNDADCDLSSASGSSGSSKKPPRSARSSVERRRSGGTPRRFSSTSASSTTPTKKQIMQSRLFRTTCGTAFYMPPEMLDSKGYVAEKVDMWAIGVLTYMLIARRPPFTGKNEREVFERAKRPPNYATKHWEKMSGEARRFVQNCLVTKPDLRYSAERALNSPWLRGAPTNNSLMNRRPSSSFDFELRVINSMRHYASYSVLKKTALMVIAHHYSDFQDDQYNNCFLCIDKNRQGYITYEELSDFVKARDPTVSQDEIARAFRCIDLDRTGVVRYMEFLAAALETDRPITLRMVEVAFNHLKDDSGYITMRSMQRLLGKGFSKREVENLIKDGDLNSDRRISREEFLHIMVHGSRRRLQVDVPAISDLERDILGSPRTAVSFPDGGLFDNQPDNYFSAAESVTDTESVFTEPDSSRPTSRSSSARDQLCTATSSTEIASQASQASASSEEAGQLDASTLSATVDEGAASPAVPSTPKSHFGSPKGASWASAAPSTDDGDERLDGAWPAMLVGAASPATPANLGSHPLPISPYYASSLDQVREASPSIEHESDTPSASGAFSIPVHPALACSSDEKLKPGRGGAHEEQLGRRMSRCSSDDGDTLVDEDDLGVEVIDRLDSGPEVEVFKESSSSSLGLRSSALDQANAHANNAELQNSLVS